MKNDTFATMTELARIIGPEATSHSVGRDLTRLGLRTNGRPTQKAFDQGLVKSASTHRGDGTGYFYVWQQEKTLALLRPSTSGEAARE